MNISFCQENLDKLLDSLEEDWNTSLIEENFGVNFSLVTHYEVK